MNQEVKQQNVHLISIIKNLFITTIKNPYLYDKEKAIINELIKYVDKQAL